MRTIPSRSIRGVPVLLGGAVMLAVLPLGGCTGDKLARTFGLTRDAPDEYTVTTRAPLSMPPDYNLRPPRPGAARPQEQSERQQAQEALAPQTALDTPQSKLSAGEAALVQEAGPAAPSDIRSRVDQDARYAANDQSFIDKVLYWRKPDIQHAQVDAQKESQRLRQNAALGEATNVGQTPIIEQRNRGWFNDLFSWL